MSTKNIISLSLFILIFNIIFFNTPVHAGLKDRAFATHNIGKVGYFTTNIGQFYPYGGQFEKTLEYPINSGRICMYRQCLMIGEPANVVSAADGRFEEFDAIGGYNSGQAKIAMSDNPATWPTTGWPIKDTQGNPIFLAQQESYCVYSDSTNWRYKNNKELDKLLDFRIYQTIYSWGVPDADKFLILKFEIENKNSRPLTQMYFNFYSDLDIGGQENDTREWSDDCINFDKNRELVYFYDSNSFSDEWGLANPFLSGVTFLKTPNNQGITDWHWIDVTVDEVAVNSAFWDSVSYYLMCSDTSFFHKNPQLKVSDYFHLGKNPINGTHYDDPATTRITDENGNLIGGAMVAYICNGPFDIQPGERVEIWLGVMVGDNEADLLDVTDKIREYYRDGFNISVVPAPDLIGLPGDRKAYLYWSNKLDVEYTNPILSPPANDLEGYILYRTTDPSLSNWEKIMRIPMRDKATTSVKARAYEFIDENVYNGFTYYYNLCAYRTAKTGKIEQSPILADLENLSNQSNAVQVKPLSTPALNAQGLESIKVVPNPYIISAVWDEARLGNSPFGEPIRNLAFTHLPVDDCTIKIFTIDGDLVKTILHQNGTAREEWNLLTDENRPIVSGVYFYHVESNFGEKVGRFAVIR